jgi:hypothetical protein
MKSVFVAMCMFCVCGLFYSTGSIQNVKHQMAESVTNDELERIWKETVRA